jgi:eukaryotic-like serine/threonine-protein kinase
MATTLPTHQPAAAKVQSPASTAPRSAGPRAFGRFALLQLLGKSELTMSWLASDPRSGQEVMLAMPRVQPADEFALEVWQRDARKASRLNHPHLAHVIELGVQDHWPYIVVDRALGMTLPEWLAAHAHSTALEQAGWLCQALEGLAYAHEAGVSHGDLQPHQLLINEHGTVRVMALACANEPSRTDGVGRASTHSMPLDPAELRTQRATAERDLLACGLLLHLLLSGESPLNETDFSRVIQRMPPVGRDLLRLPWATPTPVSEALRAIANRAVASEPRQRYLNARTFLRTLQGWCEVAGQDNGGPVVVLLDRLRTVGHLPAMPGVGQRVARLSAMDGQHTDAITEQILQDMALSFELLRQVNSAHVSAGQLSGSGPVLTVRRAVAMLGLNGVRLAGQGLRAWPGPLSQTAAAAMERTVERVRFAGHVAQLLRPAGFDSEMVYLVSALQNLGRLLVQYHFADEAEQIHQLMRTTSPPPGSETDTADGCGMSESMASLTVLGADIETLGAAVAQYWGLGEEVQHMMRRLPTHRPVRSADTDIDFLRAAASAANEAVDVLTFLPKSKMGSALEQITQRYARLLQLEPSTLAQALQRARGMLRLGAGPVSAEAVSALKQPINQAHQANQAAHPAPNASGGDSTSTIADPLATDRLSSQVHPGAAT